MRDYSLPFDLELVQKIAEHNPTPFYLYHEDGIIKRNRDLNDAFAWNPGFRQYFAVKATPNPHIVALMAATGCGADCSSPAELVICDRLGITGDRVMFTSNNTTVAEFEQAVQLGAIVNLDAPHHIPVLSKLSRFPEVISFRFNPGAESQGNVIIGNPLESKFGCTREQIIEGYRQVAKLGIRRFGLHAMVVSNELQVESLLSTASMLFKLAVEISEKTGVQVELINLGGGIGVPYRPNQDEVPLQQFGEGVRQLYESILVPAGLDPVRIMMENGRAMTGPYGFLISRVINVKESYKKYVGVDACMSNLMRPGMYGAYHHISILGRENAPAVGNFDVVGSLCENNDKFAIDRPLPQAQVGDLVVIHDAGAHGHSMGFQYNGRLRCAEFLINSEGDVRKIRRAETLDDYFATVQFPTEEELKKLQQSTACAAVQP